MDLRSRLLHRQRLHMGPGIGRSNGAWERFRGVTSSERPPITTEIDPSSRHYFPLPFSDYAYPSFLQAYGIYLSHYLDEEIFPKASAWDYASIGGFNFSMAMLMAPLVTILARNCGIHATMAMGLLFQSAGFMAASFATRIWHLHLSQGVLVGMGIGFLYVPSLPVLSQWFFRRRSLANGLSAAGVGVGGAAFAWGTEAIVRRFGICWALRITGMIALVANSAAITIIRDRNHIIRPSQLGFDRTLVRRYDVLLLLAWAFLSILGYIVLLFSLSDFALSIGLTRTQATDIIGLLNVGTAIGRPIIGKLSDKYNRLDTAGVLTLLCGLACFAFWLPATSPGLTAFFALVCGATIGVFWMVSRIFARFSTLCSSHALIYRSADYRPALCRGRRD